MIAEGKSLKKQNAGQIRAAMIGHMLAFVWIAAEPARLLNMDEASLLNQLKSGAAPSAAAVGLIAIASLLLLGMINPNWRDRIIHLRLRDPLPGCRAFTSVGPASSHVNMEQLEKTFGALPKIGAEQNRLFYKIYRDHREDISVLDAHGRYLAARDIGTITALVMLVLPWLAWLASGNTTRSFAYGVALIAVYGLCAWAAKNYSWRMVQHVLALASSKTSDS